MVMFMKVISLMTKGLAKENSFGQMVMFMKVIG